MKSKSRFALKPLAQLGLVVCALLTTSAARSDTQCMSSELTTRAAAADWTMPDAACISSDTPVSPAPAARPMLVTREKMMASGDAPWRSPSHRHPAGGDPVLGDGEFYESRVDATLPGVGPGFEFRRTYRSRVSFHGPLGHAWDHSYDKRLLGVYGSGSGREWIEPACDHTFDFQDGELNVVHFTRDPASSPVYPLWSAHGTGMYLDLYPTTNGDIQYRIRNPDGSAFVFDTTGYLAKIVDVVGNALTFDWAPSGEVLPDAKVYGPPKHLVRVHDGVRTVNYVYDANKTLQCISLGTSCGDATTRPADVLAYFTYTAKSELAAVYHGQSTVGESMVYRSSQPNGLQTYTPTDCLPNAALTPFCQRFCGAVDPNDASTCNNIDAHAVYSNYCSHVACELKDDSTTVVNSPSQIVCSKALSADPDSYCMAAYNQWPTCMAGCLAQHQCLMAWGSPQQAFWSFGTFDDLAHNITDIYDERGKLEVHNNYGEVPWNVSFDRVISQKLGGASDENTTVSFAYHDLGIEAAGGVSLYPPTGTQIYPGPYSYPDPTNVTPKGQYAEGTLCPRTTSCGTAPDGTCSIASYDAPVAWVAAGTLPPVPTSAVVITDVHGTVRTQYYDSDNNLIREVNDTTHESRDFNYDVNGYMVGSQEASGVRQCFERDSVGHATQTTTLPAPGYGGSQTPMATAFRYDAAQQVTDVWTDLFGTVGKTHMSRDAHERIAYEEHDVKLGQPPLRTTYSYDEDPSPVGIREIPATETQPDGTVNTYRQIDPSLGGPRTTTLDANGALPQHRYSVYDSRGRVTESGETGRFAVHYVFDAANRLATVGHRDSPSAAWIDASYHYDDSPSAGSPSSIIEARRNTVYGYLGPYANTVTHSVAGGASQTSCMHYSADGRLEAMILPEGNEQIYSYDAAGRVQAVLKGFDLSTPTQQWAQGCSVPARPTDDPGPAYLMARSYRAGGFVSQETNGNVTRIIHTDGFGRVIQTDGPAPTALAIASHQVGYDSRGRVVWAADTAPQSAYAKPTMTTPGLVSMSEYEYDLTDRITVERRWLVQTGEILTLSHDYDDAHRTVTNTDRGVVSSTTLDGLGRVVSGVANDGSTTTVKHYLGYDVMTTQTNQGTVLTRTMQYDTRGRVTAVLDENNVMLSSTTYDDDGHALTSSNRGSGDVVHTYDDFGHLLRVHKDLLNGGATDTRYTYDRNDRVVRFTDSAGSAWSMTYTGFDAPLTTTDPLGRVDKSVYLAGYSRPIGHVDAVGRHSCFRYDYDMRLSYVYDIDCPAEEVPYGPLTPMIERRSLEYTTVGQLALAKVNADPAHPQESIAYSYDSLGRQIDQTVGVYAPPLDFYTVHHEYPDLGRTVVTQLHGQGYSPPVVDHPPCTGDWCPPPPPPPPPPPTFFAAFRESFDSMGHETSVDLNGARMATWTWGAGIGGPQSVAYGDNTTTAYSYDARLRQTKMVVSQLQSGGIATLSRVGSLAGHGGGVITGFGGRGGIGGGGSGGGGGGNGCPPGVWCPPPKTPVTLASWQDAYGADSVVRMRQRAIGYNAPITDVYQIDGDARLTAETLALPNVTMPAGEVDEATVSGYLGQGQHWRYFDVDGNGNWRSTVAPPSGTSVPQHNDAVGRLQAIDTTTLTADSHGNLSNLTGDPLTFTYDDFSNLVVAATNGGPQYAYSYDAADRRVIESDGATQGIVVWDGARIIAHGDPAALVIEVPGRDIDEHVATVANGGTALARFYHQGPDQSMLAVTDVNGLVEGYTYSAYGEPTIWAANGSATTTSLINNRFGFQGQWLDPGTGTYSMRARQYVPRWGRFTSPDPLGLGGGPSLYSFTGSRPIAARDPSGLAPVAQNGWHGPKACEYCGGPGVFGMGDGDWGGFNSTGGYGGGAGIPISPFPDSWISSGWSPGSLSDAWILVGSVSMSENGEYRYTDPEHYGRMGDVFASDPSQMYAVAHNANYTIVDTDTLTLNALKAGLLHLPLTLLDLACADCSAKNDRMIAGIVGPFVPAQAAAVQQIALGLIMAVGPVLAEEIGAAAVQELEVATRGIGPVNQYGGYFTSETNAAGGTVWTSTGKITQANFQAIIDEAVANGEDINLITGAHGDADGSWEAAPRMFNIDARQYVNTPGVNVINFPSSAWNPGELNGILNGPGVTIGGFCDSGACLAPFK